MIAVSLRQVFGQYRYIVLTFIVASVTFAFATWLPNLGLIWQVTTSNTASVVDKIRLLVTFLSSIQTNFTFLSAINTIAIALLFGVNISMVVYYINQRRELVQGSGVAASFGGLISGMFGIGCAACGTLVLGPIITTLGGAGLVLLLPFKGQEFGLFGISLILVSIYMVAGKIQEPVVCKLPNSAEA